MSHGYKIYSVGNRVSNYVCIQIIFVWWQTVTRLIKVIVKCIEMSSHDIVHPGHSVVDQLYFKIDKLIEKETRFAVTRGTGLHGGLDEGGQNV